MEILFFYCRDVEYKIGEHCAVRFESRFDDKRPRSELGGGEKSFTSRFKPELYCRAEITEVLCEEKRVIFFSHSFANYASIFRHACGLSIMAY